MAEGRHRLHSLDALRGIAALAVVFWHWQHLQILGHLNTASASFAADQKRQPFHLALRLFYEQGYLAVDMFFVISGFIFFWLYEEKLASKKLSQLDFAVLRGSRLYPLHFATLLFAAALQALFVRMTGHPFIFPANDLFHFFLSLLVIQGVGDNAAFNAPTWSLTIEIVMYAVFCVSARIGWLRTSLLPCALFGLGAALYYVDESLAKGFCGFFGGGLAYRAFSAIEKSTRARFWAWLLFAIMVAGWAAVLFDIYSGGVVKRAFVASLPFSKHRLSSYAILYCLFPITVIVAALHENVLGARYASVAWLGEISYSSYLLHFPLQLILALLFAFGLFSAEAVRSASALVIYFVILIALSIVVYRRFEMPAQNALRSMWSGRSPRLAPPP